MSETVLALVPLDERPATASLPAQVAAVAGASVLTPPVHLLPRRRTAGDPEGLGAWLHEAAGRSSAAVVALETLGMGGLISSRIGDEPVTRVLDAWEALRQVPVPVHASAVIQRTPDSDEATEEPDYYALQGRALHAASAALAGGRRKPAGTDPAVLDDFLRRRLRNHTLNLAAIGLLLDGTLETLCIGADDTAVEAIGTAEQQWLSRWCGWLQRGNRLLTYPGADETGTALVVRAITQAASGDAPLVAIHAVGGLDRIAPYENAPVIETVRGQLRAAGGQEVSTSAAAELNLVVHTPSGRAGDFASAPPDATDEHAARECAALVAHLLASGRRVAVADCAYPNGADPALIRSLSDELGGQWERLAGFAGWNTAGNSIGSAVGHGLAVVLGERAGTFDEAAHVRLLRHRLLEDWGWMSSARRAVRARLGSDPSRHDRIPDNGQTERYAAELLQARLDELGPGWRVGDVHFPWQRTFEIDFVVETR